MTKEKVTIYFIFSKKNDREPGSQKFSSVGEKTIYDRILSYFFLEASILLSQITGYFLKVRPTFIFISNLLIFSPILFFFFIINILNSKPTPYTEDNLPSPYSSMLMSHFHYPNDSYGIQVADVFSYYLY